jgi:hypothetical protein
MTPVGLPLNRRRRRAIRLSVLFALSAAASCSIGVTGASALPTSFGSQGARAGQISKNPGGIAVEQATGDVYVADRENARVDKFGPQGEFQFAFGWGVADGETEALQTCTTTCFAGLEGSGAGEFFGKEGGPEGIAVDNDLFSLSHGDVYVVDPRNHRVQKFGPNGEFLLMFGVEGTEPGEFEGLTGRSVAVDSEGTVYVGDRNRVQRFSEAGVPEGPPVTFSGVGLVLDLAVDSAKNMYVRGDNREVLGVHKYDPAGVELGKPRDEGGFGESLDVAVGPADELFVNDLQSTRHILGFDAEGEQAASFDRTELGTLAIAYSEHAEALYVLDSGLVRIVTPPPPGPFVLLASESASQVEPTTATLAAMINPEGAASEYHFEYGATTAYGESTPVSAPLGAVNEVQSVTLAGATGGAFTLAFEGVPSVEVPFDATAAEVQVALEGIPALGPGQVAVSGEPGGPWSVEFTGARAGEDVAQLSANPSGLTGPAPGATVATTTPGFSLFDDRAASAAVATLQPNTSYHFPVVATNRSQTTLGPDHTFTTLPEVSIDQTSASEVDATSARLEAELNPHGVASEYRFEYGLTTSYGKSFPVPDGGAGSSSSDMTVENLIQELLPATTYHYRVIARNALNQPGEFVVGPDRSFTTQGASSILPDGREWEMVSPPNKHGAPVEPLTAAGGLIQSSLNGGAFAYVSDGPVDTEPQGNRSPHDTQLLARRSASGWSTRDISTPHEEVSPANGGNPSEYKFFAEDLHAGIVEPEGSTPLSAQTTERTPYRREADGEFVPLVTASNVPPGTKFGGTINPDTATPDLSHVVLVSPQALAGGFGPGFEPGGRPNLYELADGELTLVSVLPNGEPTSEAGLSAGVALDDVAVRGAISSDGDRVVFETQEQHLYVRDVGLGHTLQLDVRQPGAAGGEFVPKFRGANSDDSRVLFTDEAQLTPDATARPNRPDLYMCEVEVVEGQLSCVLSDLSVDPNAGEAANVAGTVSAIDASGSHVYFGADGVLTSTPNARGEVAVPGSCNSNEEAPCNLYEYDTNAHRLSLVAVLSSRDAPDWDKLAGIDLSVLTARSSPGGRYFTFMSQRSLTGYDNRDAHSGQRDEEVFQFDSQSGELACISCDPTGARPNGIFDKENPGPFVDRPHAWSRRWLAGSIPGWTLQALVTARYQSRYLSDSGREFFNSADALVPQDTNKTEDVYEFESPGVGDCTSSSKTYSSTSGGCVALISSGSSKEESAFLDATENGDEVFFLTSARLLTSDVDTAFDVYDARVCSVSSPCSSPPLPASAVCEGDSCQNPSSPPAGQTPGSLSYSGPGNLSLSVSVRSGGSGKPKALTRARRLVVALRACRVRSKGRGRRVCERRARRRYGVVRGGKSGYNTNRRGK